MKIIYFLFVCYVYYTLLCRINNLKLKAMGIVETMAKELKEMWQDLNGNSLLPSDYCIYWLWKKHDKKVSFKDCLTAYKMTL